MLGLPSTSISRAAEIHGVAIHRAHVCATEPTRQLMSWIRRAEQVKTNTNDLNFLVSLRDADATAVTLNLIHPAQAGTKNVAESIVWLPGPGRTKNTPRDDDGSSQSCAKPAALARFRVLVGRAAASGARPEDLLEGAREVFVARHAAAAF